MYTRNSRGLSQFRRHTHMYARNTRGPLRRLKQITRFFWLRDHRASAVDKYRMLWT
jgi:hypothetical protein